MASTKSTHRVRPSDREKRLTPLLRPISNDSRAVTVVLTKWYPIGGVCHPGNLLLTINPEEFRQAGHAAIDWIADYMKTVGEMPVLSRVEPGEIRHKLPSSPPVTGESWESVLGDLEEVILPVITHWQSPGFFAYFPAIASGPAVLVYLFSSSHGVQIISC